MVVIRLSRGGTNKRPFYHIIVTDKRKPRDSGHIERLGFYNPIATGGEIPFKLIKERFAYWVSCGAIPSERVVYLVEKFGTEGASAIGTQTDTDIGSIDTTEVNPETAV